MTYNDVITYCENTQVLIEEVKEKYPDKIYTDEETGDVSFTITKTPTKRNGDKTLTLCRVTDEDLEILNNLESLTVLGDYDELLVDDDKLALYKSVWDYETPITYTDENGNEVTYYKPKYIGKFA